MHKIFKLGQFAPRICKRSFLQKLYSPASYETAVLYLPVKPHVKEQISINNIGTITFHDVYADICNFLQIYEVTLNDLFISDNNQQSFDKNIKEFEKLAEILESKMSLFSIVACIKNDHIMMGTLDTIQERCTFMENLILNFGDFNSSLKQFNEVYKESSIYPKNHITRIYNNCIPYGGFSKIKKSIHTEIDRIIRNTIEYIQTEKHAKKSIKFSIYEDFLSDSAPIKEYFNDYKQENGKIDKSGELIICYQIPFNSFSQMDNVNKYVKDAILRNQIWKSSRNYSGLSVLGLNQSNYRNLYNIQFGRFHVSKQLGYKNYADMLLSTHQRMAKSLDEITTILDHYKSLILPEAIQELNELNTYAIKHSNLKGYLRQWDYHYFQVEYERHVLKKADVFKELCKKCIDGVDLMQRMIILICNIYKIQYTIEMEEFTNSKVLNISLTEPSRQRSCCIQFNVSPKKNLGFLFTTKVIIPDPTKPRNPTLFINVNNDLSLLPMFRIPDFIYLIENSLSWLFHPQLFFSEPLKTSVPEISQLNNYLLHRFFFSSSNSTKFLFPKFNDDEIHDLMKKFSHPDQTQTLYDQCIKLYKAYFELEFCKNAEDHEEISSKVWSNMFRMNYFQFESDDEWAFNDLDLINGNGYISGFNKYSSFWAKYHGEQVFQKFKNAGFLEWNPNSNEPMNDELRNMIAKYREIFYDDYIHRLPNELMPTFNSSTPSIES